MSDENVEALDLQMKAALSGREDAFEFTTTSSFADFLWDAGMTFDEVRRLEPAVVVDSRRNGRRLVVQRIRDELRYWITTERDPYKVDKASETEIGICDSVASAAALCIEFLASASSTGSLMTERRTLRRESGPEP